MIVTNATRSLVLKKYLEILEEDLANLIRRKNDNEDDIITTCNDMNKNQMQESSYVHETSNMNVHIQEQINKLELTVSDLKKDLTLIEKRVSQTISSLYSIVYVKSIMEEKDEKIEETKYYILVRGDGCRPIDSTIAALGKETPLGLNLNNKEVGHEFDLVNKEFEIISIN